ncbi:hypothetical protein P4493_06060 [Bacillus thuringiensis]|uniref:Uncharacterized protein n=3 Tax=Bacillus thuringiensis TaxID=1428 RepID=A0A0B5NJ86_BACTU|nr:MULTISPECIES: hypothetical protein [Bacillus]EAO53429.1 hypothetical protein RBTH_04820 [Bacillus thuringiensis serovar israelensis ATCC 35646]MEC2533128.1 hypothetical protein [Bacillus cereus]MED1153892.1 hypothetical protein [Bacillus paranthracis]OUB09263.1 hypothetical protein BK708_32535 [Bacillus thuringiensis serovar yunnanensis]AFQ30200.1 hypothetical protein BTF1_30497 [Bacillus thuringiensis HD-789]
MRTKQLHVPFKQSEYAFGYIEIQESGELKPNIPFVSRIKERLYLSVVGFKRNQEGHFILLMEMYYKQVDKLTQGKENTFFVLESKDMDTSNDEPILLEPFQGDSLDFESYVKERL